MSPHVRPSVGRLVCHNLLKRLSIHFHLVKKGNLATIKILIPCFLIRNLFVNADVILAATFRILKKLWPFFTRNWFVYYLYFLAKHLITIRLSILCRHTTLMIESYCVAEFISFVSFPQGDWSAEPKNPGG